MKVLWFTNTAANGEEYLYKQSTEAGGWLKALNKTLQEFVELHLVFYGNKNTGVFTYEKTTYYPIPKYSNLHKIKAKIFNYIIDKEDLQIYLSIINDLKPDIIHIHGTESAFGCIVNKVNIPVVISMQGIIKVISYKYCSGIERKYLRTRNICGFGLKSLMNFRMDKNKLDQKVHREQRNLLYCKYIIGRTNWDKRVCRIIAPHSSYFHNDEILRDGFYNSIWVSNRKQKLILHTTSDNIYYKGFETICLALQELNKLGIECEWRVAGIKDSDLIVKVVKRKLRKVYPLQNLKLLGRLNEKTLIEKLCEADIYIMPSHIENSPNSLCEAMMLGIPCIAAFAGGTNSILIDGQEGILIQDGDPWALAGAILELKEFPQQAIMYGNNARVKALIRHNKDKIVSDLLSIYKNILDNHDISKNF